MEEWKIIEINPNYSISSFGRVKNNTTNRILKPRKISRGYYQITLSNKGQTKQCLVHRLVAIAFIPNNVGNHAEVNHIDGDKSNNNIENLEWLSQEDNMNHAFETGIHPHSKKPVIQITKDNLVIAEFESLIEAARKTNIGVGSIHNACSGRRKSAGGFTWKFKE